MGDSIVSAFKVRCPYFCFFFDLQILLLRGSRTEHALAAAAAVGMKDKENMKEAIGLSAG